MPKEYQMTTNIIQIRIGVSIDYINHQMNLFGMILIMKNIPILLKSYYFSDF